MKNHETDLSLETIPQPKDYPEPDGLDAIDVFLSKPPRTWLKPATIKEFEMFEILKEMREIVREETGR